MQSTPENEDHITKGRRMKTPDSLSREAISLLAEYSRVHKFQVGQAIVTVILCKLDIQSRIKGLRHQFGSKWSGPFLPPLSHRVARVGELKK